MTWTKTKTAIALGAVILLVAGIFTAVEIARWRAAEQGKIILSKVVAANRFWLVGAPDNVNDYSYVLYLLWPTGDKFPIDPPWTKAPGGGVIQTPVRVTDPRNAPAAERQGITYSSLLQRLAKYPEWVRVQSVAEGDGKITLALKILQVPGARTTFVIAGKKRPIAPLRIDCGNGIKGYWHGEFQTGGSNAVLVVDAAKMVPLRSIVRVYGGTVEETYSDYTEISPGNFVPLSVKVKDTGTPKGWGDMVFDWKFKLHDGLWLFDEGQYHGEKVAWTDEVVVH